MYGTTVAFCMMESEKKWNGHFHRKEQLFVLSKWPLPEERDYFQFVDFHSMVRGVFFVPNSSWDWIENKI